MECWHFPLPHPAPLLFGLWITSCYFIINENMKFSISNHCTLLKNSILLTQNFPEIVNRRNTHCSHLRVTTAWGVVHETHSRAWRGCVFFCRAPDAWCILTREQREFRVGSESNYLFDSCAAICFGWVSARGEQYSQWSPQREEWYMDF